MEGEERRTPEADRRPRHVGAGAVTAGGFDAQPLHSRGAVGGQKSDGSSRHAESRVSTRT